MLEVNLHSLDSIFVVRFSLLLLVVSVKSVGALDNDDAEAGANVVSLRNPHLDETLNFDH